MVELNKKQKGILFAILSSSLGIDPVLFRLSLYSINPETTNLLQTLFASILFALVFIIFRKSISFKTIIKNWKGPVLIAFSTFIGGLLYTYGILFSGPTTATFIINFTRVITILFGIIFLKERFTRFEGFGILLAIVGLLIISYGQIEIQILSIIILLIASLSFAASNLFSKIYVKNVNPVALAGSRTMLIFLLFLVFSTLTGRLETNIPSMIYVYIFLASITGVFLNSILSYKSFELIKISNSIAITAIGPFFTAVYSLIILSLIPTSSQLFGGSLIVIGIIMISLTRKSPKI